MHGLGLGLDRNISNPLRAAAGRAALDTTPRYRGMICASRSGSGMLRCDVVAASSSVDQTSGSGPAAARAAFDTTRDDMREPQRLGDIAV